MPRRNADGGGPKKKVVYVKTRGGKVINYSKSGIKPPTPRVVARPQVKVNPRVAADPNPTPKGGRVGHENAKGVGFQPGKGLKAIDDAMKALAPPGVQSRDRKRVDLKAIDDAMKALAPPGVQSRDRKRVDLTEGNLKAHPAPKDAKQSAAGFSPEVTSSAKIAKNLAAVVPLSTAVTAYHQPGKTAGDTAKSVVSIPAGLIRAAVNPADSVTGIKKDYVDRYDAAAKGDYKKFHERQMKEGAAPELSDIATVATAGGATTGRIAQTAAKGGKLGKAAERVATKTTKVRLSGGDHVQVRAPSKNFYKNAANAARHNLRVRKQVRRATKRDAPAIVREAMNTPTLKAIARHNRKAAKRGTAPVSAKAMRAAVQEVTPVRLKKAERAQVRAVAHEGGVTMQRMKAEQQREVLGKTGVRGTLKNLSRDEKAAYKYQAQYAPKSAADAKAILIRHRDRIKAERAKNPVRPVVDELPVLDHLIKNADQAFTDNLRAAVKVENNRSRRLAAGDPGVNMDQALTRIHQPVAELLGIERRRAVTHNDYARTAMGAQSHHDGLVTNTVDYELAKANQNELRAQVDRWKKTLDHAQFRLKNERRTNGGRAHPNTIKDAAAAQKRLAEMRKRLAHAEDVVRSHRVTRADIESHMLKHGVNPAGETAVQFTRRVRREGSKHGLGAPAYFKSEEIPSGVRHMFAKGGNRAIKGPGVYTGALTKTGRESGDVAIAERSAAQSIKRKFNWNHVADTVDQHVLPWSREKSYTAHELNKELIRRGIDPNSVRLWNPRLMREQRKAAVAGEHGADAADPSFSSQHVSSALDHATADVHDLALNKEQFQATGWQVAPKHVIDEVTDTATAGRAEGKVARGYDITKGQISRVLLANPAWLGFQVASNSLMTGLAGVTPADLTRSMRFFKNMDPAKRADLEAMFGTHGWFKDQRRMGAAGGSMTRAWETVKDTPFYRRGLEGKSPLDALFFRPDNAQNNMFRRALMYNRLKRETYRRLGEDASQMVRLQQRLTGMLKGNPEEHMRALAANKKVVEQYAQHVDDFLGNWTRYTAKERHVFSRFVMFYGFLRFATRLAFYTMPVKHPIMSSILLQIGRLEKDEITRIFGTEPPPWEVGNLYAPTAAWGQKASKDQANTRIPTTRLVPFFNAMQYDSPGAAIGMANPVVGIALNQAAGKNIPLDQPYTVRGSTAYVQHSGDLSLADRAHLIAADVLHLSPWERAAEAATMRGKQGSDSSLLFPRPVKFKNKGRGKEAQARNQRLIAEQNANGALGQAAQVLLPQFGTDGNRRIKSAQEWAKRQDGKPAKKKVKGNEMMPGGTVAGNEMMPR